MLKLSNFYIILIRSVFILNVNILKDTVIVWTAIKKAMMPTYKHTYIKSGKIRFYNLIAARNVFLSIHNSFTS